MRGFLQFSRRTVLGFTAAMAAGLVATALVPAGDAAAQRASVTTMRPGYSGSLTVPIDKIPGPGGVGAVRPGDCRQSRRGGRAADDRPDSLRPRPVDRQDQHDGLRHRRPAARGDRHRRDPRRGRTARRAGAPVPGRADQRAQRRRLDRHQRHGGQRPAGEPDRRGGRTVRPQQRLEPPDRRRQPTGHAVGALRRGFAVVRPGDLDRGGVRGRRLHPVDARRSGRVALSSAPA